MYETVYRPVTLVVRDYDEAIAFYTQKLSFTLVEDTPSPEEQKRWVVVAHPGGGTGILLARASKPEQEAFVGNQSGGRVFLFLSTDDFWRDYRQMEKKASALCGSPRRRITEPWPYLRICTATFGI